MSSRNSRPKICRGVQDNYLNPFRADMLNKRSLPFNNYSSMDKNLWIKVSTNLIEHLRIDGVP